MTSREDDELLGSSADEDEATLGSVVLRGLVGDPFGAIAQAGLVTFAVLLWQMLWTNPAGLFTYHPSFQSVAIILLTQGVLSLQPTRSAPAKSTGRKVHQIFQLTALLLLLAGAVVIIYNKVVHGAAHFTTWHGKLGLIALSLVLVQIVFGALVLYPALTGLVGGEERAKSLWKYHRVLGYFVMTLLFVTPLTALQSDWVLGHSTRLERLFMALGLILAFSGLTARISPVKFGLADHRRVALD